MNRRSRLLRTPLVLTLAATLWLAAGCGDDEEPEAGTSSPAPTETASEEPSETAEATPSESASPSEEPGQSVAITIQGDDVTPVAQQVELGVGEELVLEVTSDRAGELHVHSNPEQEPAFKQGTSSITLSFDKPGQVDVEEHESHSLILRLLVK